jgi:hypothetical protein
MNTKEIIKKMTEDHIHEYKVTIDFPDWADMNAVENAIHRLFKDEEEVTDIMVNGDIGIILLAKTEQAQLEWMIEEIADHFDFEVDREPYYERTDC